MDRFLGPGGWSTEGRGAQILLRALQNSNEFFRAADGSWQPLEGEEVDSVRQQALRWVLRSSRNGIRCTGLLAVDQEMREGLLRDLDFDMISDNEFVLSPADAKEFGRRVRASGGVLEKGQPLPTPPPPPSKSSDKLEKQIAAWTALDIETLRQVEGGDRSGVLEFNERGPRIRELVEKSRSLGGREFEQELLLRAGAEERMRVLLGDAPSGASAALPAMLQQLAMLWEENGQTVERNGGEVAVLLPEGRVVISTSVSFTSSKES